MRYKEAQELIVKNTERVIKNMPLKKPARELKGFIIAPLSINKNDKFREYLVKELIEKHGNNELVLLDTVPHVYGTDKLFPFVVFKMNGISSTISLDDYLATLDLAIKAKKTS